MSFPIRNSGDPDEPLEYAQPWARRSGTPPIEERPRIRRLDKASHDFSGDRAMLELQRRLALDPDRVPEPPAERSGIWWVVAGACAVVGAAALVAWAIVFLPGAKKAGIEAVQTNSAAPQIADRDKQERLAIAPPVRPVDADQTEAIKPPPVIPQRLPPALAVRSIDDGRIEANKPSPALQERPTIGTAAQPANDAPPLAVSPGPAPQSGPASPSQPRDHSTLRLEADEIATLLKRGKDDLTNGDVASARLLLRRAAEATSAEAALVLGSTFDPLVLQRSGAIGIKPDVAQARKWYERAVELGSAAAALQLAKLAQEHP
jgi:hypothetical protein